MIVSMWSFKGGQGLTTTAALTALAASTNQGEQTLLVDLDGDQPAVFGTADMGVGLAEWSRTNQPADKLAGMIEELTPTLSLLPRGSGPITPRADELVDWLNDQPARVVVDAGTLPRGDRELANGQIEMGSRVTAAADRNWAVTRSCYLSLRRSIQSVVRPHGVVLVAEPARALTRSDIERAVGAPVVATIAFDPDISRAVDAGMIRTRVPKAPAKTLGAAIGGLPAIDPDTPNCDTPSSDSVAETGF